MLYIMISTRRSGVVYKLQRTGIGRDASGTPNGIYVGHEREPDISYPFIPIRINAQ